MKGHNSPPRWIKAVLEKYCDSRLLEGILGDLDEVYTEHLERKSKSVASWAYAWNALGFLRMVFRKKLTNNMAMRSIWFNYLLAAFRSGRRQKFTFSVNVLGLVLAISCSLYALIYINDELQFDTQHEQSDQIFRLHKRYINVQEQIDHLTYETSGMMGPTMKSEFPEVEEFVRVLPWWDPMVLTHKRTHISTDHAYFADSTFFKVFDFKLLRGNPDQVLTAPSSIVLSESLAKAIFSDQDPIGKVVKGLHYEDLEVTGIMEDVPRQSSFRHEAIISWSTTVPGVGVFNMRWMNNWLAQGIYTFVRLQAGAKSADVVPKLSEMMKEHFPERSEQYFLKLQPLSDMYLKGYNIRGTERMRSGSIVFTRTLGFSALLIFLIAATNYINMALSKASRARKEVGVRKVMGSTKKQLIGRFVVETFIITTIASILSFILVLVALPYINPIVGKELPLVAAFQPIVWVSLAIFVLGVSLLVGFYPALVIASPSITSILKSADAQTGSVGALRKLLLGIQYMISIFLIICTIIFVRQIHYLENKPLGMDKDNILVLDIGNEVSDKADVLESELLTHPNVEIVSISRSALGGGSYTTSVFPEGYGDEFGARIYGVDQEFFETYGIKTVLGRTFLPGSVADSNRLVVNEAFVKFMDWDDPIGKHVRFSEDSQPVPIMGVVNDFHIESLASGVVEPMILYLNLTTQWYASIKLGQGSVHETIAFVEGLWNQLARRTPFNYYFVDDWFHAKYEKERQLLKIATYYASVSILLSLLGLLGLTSLLLQHRIKEIGIRKVLGASVASILQLMNKQFIPVIGVSFVLASPLAFWLMSDLLNQFANRINVDQGPFIIALISTIMTSVLIIVLTSLKSAHTNPSKILKSE